MRVFAARFGISFSVNLPQLSHRSAVCNETEWGNGKNIDAGFDLSSSSRLMPCLASMASFTWSRRITQPSGVSVAAFFQ